MKKLIPILVFMCVCSIAFAQKVWEEYKGTHFVIYYKDAPMDFVNSVYNAAENYYQEISENLGFNRYKSWSWDERATIYIYSNDEDYYTSGRQARWSHGAASAKEKIIRTFPSDHGFFDSTLPHEMGHIIFREFIGYKSQIPIWMDEGIAMYQEKARRWGAKERVRKAIEDGTFVSLPELGHMLLTSNTDVDTISLFYDEAASIIYYMITELGQERFVHLCRELRDGSNFEEAIHAAYVRFHGIEDLGKSWEDYLRQ